jgi:hypothetical protein
MVPTDLLARIAAGRTDLVLDLAPEIAATASTAGGHESPLVWCAYYGDVTALRLLLERGVPDAALGPNLGLTGAAFHGHWRLAQFLIERGADPNHPEPDTGETPLHAALSREAGAAQHQTVRVLLAAGADPAARTVDGAETGSFMRDARTRGETPLHRAAAFASGETIDLLLATGVALDIRDARGETPLGWGSWARRPDDILRRLCFGPHRIREGRRPMADSLVGEALP